MEKYNKFEQFIKDAKSILLVTHINPDGDALGSMCALHSAIYKRFKKHCDMVLFAPIPDRYAFLPDIKRSMQISDCDKSREYDLVITDDVAAEDRIHEAKPLFDKAKHTICLDHHITNIGFGEISFIEPYASSTGEVIFRIFEKLNWEIDTETAISLYTAILTDTGNFRYENTTPEVFRIVGELLKRNINITDLYRKCYEYKNKNFILFQSYCMSKAKFEENDKIAYTIIYKKDYEKLNLGEDASDGIAEALRAISTTEVSFSAKEVEHKVCKLSLRSKNVDVSKICSKFNGGGHQHASGCTLRMSCEKAVKILLEEIKKEL